MFDKEARPTHWMNVEDNRPLVYLACPYSHPDRTVRVMRFEAANRAASMLMDRGEHVFSPISHTHSIAESCDLPLDWEFWQDFERSYLSVANRLFLLLIPGWSTSTGVTAEIAIANKMDILITYLSPEEAGVIQ